MKLRLRAEKDPRFSNSTFYYIEKKVLWWWHEIKMTANIDIAHTVYQSVIDGTYNNSCTNIIIATYP